MLWRRTEVCSKRDYKEEEEKRWAGVREKRGACHEPENGSQGGGRCGAQGHSSGSGTEESEVTGNKD